MLNSFSVFFPRFHLELAWRALFPIAEVSDGRLACQGSDTALDFVRWWDAQSTACQSVKRLPEHVRPSASS